MEKLARNEGSSSHSSSTGCFAGLRQGTFLDRRPSHKHLTGVARVTWKQLLSSGGCNPQKNPEKPDSSGNASDTLWLFNIAMEAMAHRNRWCLPINSMVIFQFANCECHNQRGRLTIFLWPSSHSESDGLNQ